MTFRYSLKKTHRPVQSLNGRMARPRAIISFAISGRGGLHADREGLLDTGADDTVFEGWIAAKIGLDLTDAPEGEAQGVGGVVTAVRYAVVTFRISDGIESREWDAWVAFTSARLRQPLPGFAGFLQFFDAHFFGQREEVELTANGLFPVRQSSP